jgi:hypothetical protein
MEKRTLAGAFQADVQGESQTAFGKIGVRCEGQNPALGISQGRSQTRYRGAGRTFTHYFAARRTSISPRW